MSVQKLSVNSVFSVANKNHLWFAGLTILLVAVVLLAIGDGAMKITPAQVAAILAKQIGIDFGVEFVAQQESVLLAIRLPRVLLGLLIGAGLAISGTLLQGLFRNPLAEPSLLGVSSGAALAAVAVIVLGERIAVDFFAANRFLLLPVAAFGGGMLTVWAVYRLGRRSGFSSPTTTLLAGIAINALCGAAIGWLTFLASDAQLRSITFWTLGSVGGATWNVLAIVAPFLLLPILWFGKMARNLNALALGEAEAAHLGVNVENLKRLIILTVALVVGVAVSAGGIIGFVGLVVPHLLRLASGADHRRLLPASGLLGGSLLVGADWASRTLVAPAELPVGIVTAIVGAPFFLWLLLREKR